MGIPIGASPSDLASFYWQTNGIIADFFLPDDQVHLLRVFFDRQCIVRLLDDMPLSTEDDDTRNVGLVPGHFAYRVEAARFASIQSETWMESQDPVTHYRFITGWACMDVLSSASPKFSRIAWLK